MLQNIGEEVRFLKYKLYFLKQAKVDEAKEIEKYEDPGRMFKYLKRKSAILESMMDKSQSRMFLILKKLIILF